MVEVAFLVSTYYDYREGPTMSVHEIVTPKARGGVLLKWMRKDSTLKTVDSMAIARSNALKSNI